MASIERVVVGAVDEFPAGARRQVQLNGRSILCLNVEGTYYAVSGKCPHQGASLYFAGLCGHMLPSDPHRYVYGRHDRLLRCPWHGWQFDIETGASLFDDKTGLLTYEVEVADGEIAVLVPVLS